MQTLRSKDEEKTKDEGKENYVDVGGRETGRWRVLAVCRAVGGCAKRDDVGEQNGSFGRETETAYKAELCE